ncbi:MAG: SpoIIE family protein phosphatase [Planctomycetota bacterium]
MLIAGPVLVAVLTMAVLAWVQGERSAESVAREVADRAADRITTRLEGLATLPDRVNDIMTTLVSNGQLDVNDLASWRSVLRSQVLAFEDLGYLTFGTSDGRAVWVIRYPDGDGAGGGPEYLEFALKDDPDAPSILETRLDADGNLTSETRQSFNTYDPRLRPWYTAAIERDGPGFSELFSWQAEGGQSVLGLGYGEPVTNADGTLLGVIDAGLSLGDVSRFLRSLDLGQGVAFVVDAEGNLVGTGGEDRVVTSDGTQLAAADAKDPRVRAAAAVLSEGFQYTSVDVPDLGRSRVEIVPFDGGLDLPWRIVTVLPDADFLGGVTAARRFTLLAGMLLVAFALLGGLLLGRRAVRPILDIEQQVGRIGGGDLDTPVSGRGARELVTLGSSLDTMRQNLIDGLRLRQGIEVAMEVQQNLLPSDPPEVPGLDVAGKSVYCDETGGDYFDFIETVHNPKTGKEDLVVALGDVMGHGIAAALLMTTARAALRSRSRIPGSTGDLLTHVNDLLVPDTGGTKFMTMALVVLDPVTRTLRWASAGHDSPLLYDPEADTFTEPEGGSFPLGVVEETEYEEHEVASLTPGTIILLGTDGIWEAADSSGVQWGKEPLHDIIRQHAQSSADEIATAIHDAVEAFTGGKQEDDVTLVVAKLTDTDPPTA